MHYTQNTQHTPRVHLDSATSTYLTQKQHTLFELRTENARIFASYALEYTQLDKIRDSMDFAEYEASLAWKALTQGIFPTLKLVSQSTSTSTHASTSAHKQTTSHNAVRENVSVIPKDYKLPLRNKPQLDKYWWNQLDSK